MNEPDKVTLRYNWGEWVTYIKGYARPATEEEILEALNKAGSDLALVPPVPIPPKYSPALLMFVVLLIMIILAGVFILGIELQMMVWVQHQVESLRF